MKKVVRVLKYYLLNAVIPEIQSISLTIMIIIILALMIKYIFEGSVLMKKNNKSEESYRNLAEKYEAIINNLQEVIFQLDSQGNILFLNNSWEKLTCFTIEESKGKKILDFIILEELKDCKSDIKDRVFKQELSILTKNKETKMVELTMIPLFSQNGKMDGFSGTIHDVTMRKEQEHLLKAGKQYVELFNRKLETKINEEITKNRKKDHLLIQQSRMVAMEELIESISHQWRQPLNCLSLLIQDVKEALEFGEINHQYIDGFTRESMIQIKQLSDTINDFRKIYRPTMEASLFSLSSAIEDALSIFTSSLKNHNIHIQFEYRGQQNVIGCQNEFSQAVLNILINARDAFIEHNVKNRMITIKIEEGSEVYSIHFTDNAGGIEASFVKKIFDPYFLTKSKGQGFGLGLFVTRMILENMNGSIHMENINDGARFSIFVPKIIGAVQEHS